MPRKKQKITCRILASDGTVITSSDKPGILCSEEVLLKVAGKYGDVMADIYFARLERMSSADLREHIDLSKKIHELRKEREEEGERTPLEIELTELWVRSTEKGIAH